MGDESYIIDYRRRTISANVCMEIVRGAFVVASDCHGWWQTSGDGVVVAPAIAPPD